MEVSKQIEEFSCSNIYQVKVTVKDMQSQMPAQIFDRVVEKVSDRIAEDIYEKCFAEVMAKISTDAMANLALTNVAGKVCETLMTSVEQQQELIKEDMKSIRDRSNPFIPFDDRR
jgi:Mg/Co/Ni transporter MgtE